MKLNPTEISHPIRPKEPPKKKKKKFTLGNVSLKFFLTESMRSREKTKKRERERERTREKQK